MYGNLTFWSVTLTEESKAVIAMLVKRIIKLTYFCPIYMIDTCYCIMFLYTREKQSAVWSAMCVCIQEKAAYYFAPPPTYIITNRKWYINVWVCFHLFRQGRTRGFLIMAVIADPLCSLPSLCQRLSEQNVCIDEGVPFSLPCISVFVILCGAAFMHLYPMWNRCWIWASPSKHCRADNGRQVMDCVRYSVCFPSWTLTI